MQFKRMLCLCVAAGLAQLALADELPFTDQSLAVLQGALDFCTRVNPGDAAKYGDQAKFLVQDVPGEAVGKIRNSDEYKAAYDMVSAELGKISSEQAAETCKGFLPPEKDQES
jgi:hypothetical protein